MSASLTSAIVAIALIGVFVPAALAQLIIGDSAVHERLEVTIRADGSAHVLHEVKKSSTPVTLLSVDGEYENVRMTDEDGNAVQHGVSEHEGGFGVSIFGAEANTIVEYDLVGAVSDGQYKSWNYTYPASTLFVMPPGIERVYLNAVAIDGRVLCHGCFALLEYSDEERTHSYTSAGDATGHGVEVRTAAEVTDAGFDADALAISMVLNPEAHAFVDVVIPNMLLEGPYEAYLDGERLLASVTAVNATHSLLQTRAGTAGVLNVFGAGSSGPAAPGGTPDATLGIAVIIAGAAGAGITLAVWSRRRRAR